jgi:hypothetical protein
VGVGGARHLEQELRIVGAGCVVFAASGGLAAPVALHACGREPRFSMRGLPSCSAHHRHSSSLHSFRLRSIAVAGIMFSPLAWSLHSIRRSMLGPFHKFLHDCRHRLHQQCLLRGVSPSKLRVTHLLSLSLFLLLLHDLHRVPQSIRASTPCWATKAPG